MSPEKCEKNKTQHIARSRHCKEERNGFQNPNGLFPTRFEALEAHAPTILQVRRRQRLHALRRPEVARGIQQARRQVQTESQTLRRESLQNQR